jgi:hypothetical protein
VKRTIPNISTRPKKPEIKLSTEIVLYETIDEQQKSN